MALQGLQNERVQSFIRTVFLILTVGVIAYLIAFFVNTPPRSAKPNNFARPEIKKTMDSYVEILAKFWAFHGPHMAEWWEGADKDTESMVYHYYQTKGQDTVLSGLYYEAQPDPVNRRGKMGFDVRVDYYRFPGRKYRGETLQSVEKPSLVDADPAHDYQIWADKKLFEPMVKVSYDKKEFNMKTYDSNMRKHERYDLFASALPLFVKELHKTNLVFKHVRLGEIPATVAKLSEGSFDDPGSLPEFVVRYGASVNDEGCISLVRSRLIRAKEVILSEVKGRIHATMIDDSSISRGIAENVTDDDVHGLDDVCTDTLIAKVSELPAVEGTALAYAGLAVRLMHEVLGRLDSVIHSVETEAADFLANAPECFEMMASALLSMLRVTDQSGERSQLFAMYSAWESSVDPIRAMTMQDEVQSVKEQLAGMSPQGVFRRVAEHLRAGGKESLAAEAEAVADKMRKGSIPKEEAAALVLSTEGILTPRLRREVKILSGCADEDEYYKTRYNAYVNAVNASVYATEYVNDAKNKWNTRHVNSLATEYFYKIYFKDIWQVYFARPYGSAPKSSSKKYSGVLPPRDCTTCHQPYKSELGGVYTTESVTMLTTRFWQMDQLVDEMRDMLDNAIDNAMKNDCNFGWAKRLEDSISGKGVYDRSMIGRFGWASRQGGGNFGGTDNTMSTYLMRLIDRPEMWITDINKWKPLYNKESPAEDKAATRASVVVLSVGFNEVVDLVFEDCQEGGTLIYTKYPDVNGRHRYLAADEKGKLSWDNYIDIDSVTFSGCSAGSRNSPENNFAGNAGFSRRKYGENTSYGAMKDDAITVRTVEGFATECDDGDDGIEYCSQGGLVGAPSDMISKGLFEVRDVTDPPTRTMIGSVRKVVITSLSPRIDSPEYDNKRLVVIGINPQSLRGELVLIDDVPQNRNRAEIELVNRTLNANGATVIGSSVRAEQSEDDNGYPFFLATEPVTVREGSRLTEKGEVKVKSMRTTLWNKVNSDGAFVSVAASILTAWLSVATFGKSYPVSILSGLASGAFATSAAGSGFRSVEAAKGMVSVAISSGLLIYNHLGGATLNPFTQSSTRWVLSLAVPGLYPEFELVPYRYNMGTIGVDRNTTVARYTMRDVTNLSNTVVLIPAKEERLMTGDGSSVVPKHAPMFTEHDGDNYNRLGNPFYVFSLKKGCFLVPPAGGDQPPTWVFANDGGSDEVSEVFRLSGTAFAMEEKRVYGESGIEFRCVLSAEKSQSEEGSDEQRLFRDFGDSAGSFRILNNTKERCLVVKSGKLFFVDKTGSSVEYWTYDEGNRLVNAFSMLCVEAEWNASKKRYTGKLVGSPASASNGQKFVMEKKEDSNNRISFTEKDILRGKSPETGSIKPWYFYEMGVNDPDVEDFSSRMEMEPPIRGLSVELSGWSRDLEESRVKQNHGSGKLSWRRPKLTVSLVSDKGAPSVVVAGRWVRSEKYETNPFGFVVNEGDPALWPPTRELALSPGTPRTVYNSVMERTVVMGPRTKVTVFIDEISERAEYENPSYDEHLVKHIDGITYPQFHNAESADLPQFSGRIVAERLSTPDDKLPSPS